MKISSLLRDEGSQDDQVLETDVMRFVAIIGIVFWIIFALIKSIPFQMPEINSTISQPIVEDETMPATPQTQISHSVEKEAQPVSVPKDENPAPEPSEPAAKDTKEAEWPKPPIEGLQMQFHSLDDLMELMAGQRIRLFCRARTTGFDLFFEAEPHGKTVRFRGVKSLPPKLWEIKNGKDYSYFLGIIAETYPAIRSFTTRQVMVAFADQELENLLEQTLARLDQEGQSGILSITRNGKVVYSPQGPYQAEK